MISMIKNFFQQLKPDCITQYYKDRYSKSDSNIEKYAILNTLYLLAPYEQDEETEKK